MAALKPDMVVIGSPDVPGVQAIMQALMQQHFTPKILAASAGPDQGGAFLSAIGGSKNATGTMVPNGWYAGFNNPLSHAFVNDYIAKYGGTPAEINADAAEAYSVGETLATAVNANKSLSNTKVISYLSAGRRRACRPCRGPRSSTPSARTSWPPTSSSSGRRAPSSSRCCPRARPVRWQS